MTSLNKLCTHHWITQQRNVTTMGGESAMALRPRPPLPSPLNPTAPPTVPPPPQPPPSQAPPPHPPPPHPPPPHPPSTYKSPSSHGPFPAVRLNAIGPSMYRKARRLRRRVRVHPVRKSRIRPTAHATGLDADAELAASHVVCQDERRARVPREVDHTRPARHTRAFPVRLVLVRRDALGSRAHPRGHLCTNSCR